MASISSSLDPLNDGISFVRLIDWMGSSLDIVCDARQSFEQSSAKWSEKDQKLLNYLVKHQHTSPFRGVVTKWQVKAPLFIARQWWKHVIGGTYANDQLGWNEKSFRYCEADSEEFYMPREFRRQSESNKQASAGPLEGRANDLAMIEYAKGLQAAKGAYQTLLALGVSKEQARGVLPTSLYTSFTWTCSLQALLHFISLRSPADAQGEIQAYAQALSLLARPLFKEAFDAFEANDCSF
ncbi:MAG: FAD-dependent thymidylate synthase [Chitinophagia bacterium]|nr:FAD-dependent thymidylate synthase [Chitinophagia bacterium]